MKYFLIIISFTLSVFATQNYVIQVISVEHNASVTDTFMQKVVQAGLPYTQEKVGKELRVYVGDFKTHDEAEFALDEVRQKVAKDAFVFKKEKAVAHEPKLKMQQAMLMAQARTLKKMKDEEVKPLEKELKTVEPIKLDTIEEKIVITKKETKTVVVMKEDVKTQEIYCKDTKQALRETEIASAIAFYESSSYYTFSKGKD